MLALLAFYLLAFLLLWNKTRVEKKNFQVIPKDCSFTDSNNIEVHCLAYNTLSFADEML